MKIAVTGSNGFLGSNLVNYLKDKRLYVRQIQRKAKENIFQINSINRNTNWNEALKGIDVVVHCANSAHKINQNRIYDLELLLTNVEGTTNLTKACIKNNVKKLIFISSIKVLGEKNTLDKPFTNFTKPNPQDIYAWSKLNAEESIKEICYKSNTKYTIIRPPLLFGPGAKANFKRLINIVNLQLPLPFGSINNMRSFMYIENLSSFIYKCIICKDSENETFVISDSSNYSTKGLIKELAHALSKRAIIFKFPKKILEFLFFLVGKSDDYKKLTNTLIINSEESFKQMNWNPEYESYISIAKSIREYSKIDLQK